MKAILISPEQRTLEDIEITGRDDIVKLIGFDTLESESLSDTGDRLYFDEECFLRGAEGRFQIDKLIPVAGKGIIIGTRDDGATLQDVQTGIEELRARIQYL
jgi:hypothetical protein